MEFKHDVSIVLAGAAGQGVQTIEFVLTRILKLSGYNVFATKEYMSRVRGGINSIEIRIGSEPVSALLERIDILVPLQKGAISRLKSRITEDTVILCDSDFCDGGDEFNHISAPITRIAEDIGNKIYSNIVAVGIVSGILNIDKQIIESYLKKHFSKKSDQIISDNIKAAFKGYKTGTEINQDGKMKIELDKDTKLESDILVNGAEAIGLGAIAGGCNFICSYPMSPSTGVLVFLSAQSNNFGIISEQAEDEISAINMTLGAWFAGARAMVTTSGGGFALMEEGISLAGILENPAVIHLAQRPGPGTGLPTRTEQGDLNLALYAGHGEFPRIIYSPGRLEDGFRVMQKAFNLADKYQAPVIILTDQYYMDSYYNLSPAKLKQLGIEKFIIKTKPGYKRYEITEDGISPRGVPGNGKGLVCADSDEHDETGHITEGFEVRVDMVDKRFRKLNGIIKECEAPELFGSEDYDNLVVCWGSTVNSVLEARNIFNDPNTSVLYFSQVYPLHPQTEELLEKANQTILVEGNASGQFGNLIKQETGHVFDHRILKYNGLQFMVEELVKEFKDLLQEK